MSLSVDALKYSIMSYRDYVGDDIDGVGPNFFPTTPMLYDVLALQTLYGANWNYRSGNDTYSWAPGAKVYETIWDGGGMVAECGEPDPGCGAASDVGGI